MKTKLEMAHEWAMKHGNAETVGSRQNMVKYAWEYADAMQAEADKRKPSGLPNVLRGACGEIVAVKVDDKEWQPDWSQAPDNLVKYFAVDANGRGGWFISTPTLCIDHWYWSDFEERVDNDNYDYAPSFGYTGD